MKHGGDLGRQGGGGGVLWSVPARRRNEEEREEALTWARPEGRVGMQRERGAGAQVGDVRYGGEKIGPGCS